jgi:phosphoesterase RecJ-like protein
MVLENIIQEIRRKRKFLVTTHVNPEGDAVGSALGLTLALKDMGKEVSLILKDPIPIRLKFLPESHLCRQLSSTTSLDPDFDTMFVVDCGDLERVGFVRAGHLPAPVMVNIDHHVTNTRYGHLNWIVEDATASGEMVYTLLRRMEVPISPEIATCLYTTLMTETGGFRFSNTTAGTFHLAGELTRLGADPCGIAEEIYHTSSRGRLKLLASVIEEMEVSPCGRIAWVRVPRSLYESTGTTVEDSEDLVHFPRSLQGVEVAMLFRETNEPGIVKASLRSNRNLDVSRVAMKFDGGGHRKAAGFSMKGSLKEVQAATLEAVREALAADAGR